MITAMEVLERLGNPKKFGFKSKEEVMAWAANYMDNDLRESVHNKTAPCSDVKFIESYEQAHFDKFGEEWSFN